MIRLVAISLLVAAALACLVIAWLAHARYSAQVDRWARIYRVQRLPGEDIYTFRMRVIDRAHAFHRGIL